VAQVADVCLVRPVVSRVFHHRSRAHVLVAGVLRPWHAVDVLPFVVSVPDYRGPGRRLLTGVLRHRRLVHVGRLAAGLFLVPRVLLDVFLIVLHSGFLFRSATSRNGA
jgi:hypothetical protein